MDARHEPGPFPGIRPTVPKAARRAGGWLVTLADLIALLLCFFVMMFAMSALDAERWDALSQGLRNAMPARDETERPRPDADPAARPLPAAAGLDTGYLRALLARQIAADEALDALVLSVGDDTITLTFPEGLLFADGGTILRPEGRHAVLRLGRLLGNVGNEIAVRGRARATTGSDGWERSLAAAAAVAIALREGSGRPSVRALGAAPTAGGGRAPLVEIVIRENGVR